MKLGRLACLLVSPPPTGWRVPGTAPRRRWSYGISDALLVLGGLGLDPWDVLHQGLARWTGIPIGTWTIIVGAAVLLLWIPLRQRPVSAPPATSSSSGTVIDLVLAVVPAPHALPVRWVSLLRALRSTAWPPPVTSGPGRGPDPGRPDDRLRPPRPLAAPGAHVHRAERAGGTGWLLGGTVGIGTALYAVGIGPLVHLLLPRLTIRPRHPPAILIGCPGCRSATGRRTRTARGGPVSGSARVTSSSIPLERDDMDADDLRPAGLPVAGPARAADGAFPVAGLVRIALQEEVYARLDAQDHRRVIKTHTPLDGIPLDARATYVVVARHPLDMAVSALPPQCQHRPRAGAPAHRAAGEP